MQTQNRLRIALADLLILVAAAALGMAVLRTTIESSGGGYIRRFPSPHSHWVGPLGYDLPFNLFFGLYNVAPQVLVASLAVVVLSLRGRRASTIPLSRRPGFLLCLAAVTVSSWRVVVNRESFWLEDVLVPLPLARLVVFGIVPKAAFTVIASWLVLGFTGRGAPVRSPLDCVGYALGVVWVMLLILDLGRLGLEWARLM